MQARSSSTASQPLGDTSKWQEWTSKQASLLLDKLAANVKSSTLAENSSQHVQAAAGIRQEIQALRNLIERDVLKDHEKLIHLRNEVISSIARKKAHIEEDRLKVGRMAQDSMDITAPEDENVGNDEGCLAWERRNEEHNQWLLQHKIQSEMEIKSLLEPWVTEVGLLQHRVREKESAVYNFTTTSPQWQLQPLSPPPQTPPTSLQETPAPLVQLSTLLQQLSIPPEQPSTPLQQLSCPLEQSSNPLAQPSGPLKQPSTALEQLPNHLQPPQTAVLQPTTSHQPVPTASTPPASQIVSNEKLQVLGELIVVDGDNGQNFLTNLVEAIQKEKYDVAAAAKSIGKALTTGQNISGSSEISSMIPFKIPTPATSRRLPSRPTAMDMTDRAARGTSGGLDNFMDAFNSNKLNYLKDPKDDKAKLLEGFRKAPAVPPNDGDGFLVPALVQKASAVGDRRGTFTGVSGPNNTNQQQSVSAQFDTDKDTRGRSSSTSYQSTSREQRAITTPVKQETENKNPRCRRSRSRSRSRRGTERRHRSGSRSHRKQDYGNRPRRSRSPSQASDSRRNKPDRDNHRRRSHSRGTGYHSAQNNAIDSRHRAQSRGARHHTTKERRHRSESRGVGYQGGGWERSGNHYVNYSANPDNNPELELRNQVDRAFTPDFTQHVSGWGVHPEDKRSPQWGKAAWDDDN